MAPRKPNPITADAKSLVHSAKVAKPKPKSTTRAKTGHATVKPSVEPYRVKRYRNGILNLSKTPPHLVAIAQRNAAESPLLRLPPELRNRIWILAMADKLVVLPNRNRQKCYAVRETSRVNALYYHYADVDKIPAAFHLPEVCRQIYAETCLTAYQHNTFLLEYPYKAAKDSVGRFMLAQRRSITKIQFHSYCLRIELNTKMSATAKLITKSLPNLSSIVVTKYSLKYLQERSHKYQGMTHLHGEGMWREWIESELRGRYGPTVDIVFE